MSNYDKIYEYGSYFELNKYVLPVGSLRQVSELSLVKGGEIVEHTQSCDEITYVISGKAIFFSGDDVRQVSQGDVHYIKTGVKHKIIADKDEDFRYICFAINFKEDYDEIKDFLEIKNKDFIYAKDDGSIKCLSELLVNEFYIKDKNSDTMINAFITQILISLVRLYKIKKIEKRLKWKPYKDSGQTLREILKYIDRNYINIKNIKEISEELSYSGDYISHLFKRKLGISIKEYLLKKKINEAKELLVTTNLRIEEISDYLNFNTTHTFYQAFKRITEMSPMEYKRKSTNLYS